MVDYSSEYSKQLTEICNEFELEKINTNTDNNTINFYNFDEYISSDLIQNIPFGDFSFIPLKQQTFLSIAFNTIGAYYNMNVFNNSEWYFPLFTNYIKILNIYGIFLTDMDFYMVMTTCQTIHMFGWDKWVKSIQMIMGFRIMGF